MVWCGLSFAMNYLKSDRCQSNTNNKKNKKKINVTNKGTSWRKLQYQYVRDGWIREKEERKEEKYVRKSRKYKNHKEKEQWQTKIYIYKQAIKGTVMTMTTVNDLASKYKYGNIMVSGAHNHSKSHFVIFLLFFSFLVEFWSHFLMKMVFSTVFHWHCYIFFCFSFSLWLSLMRIDTFSLFGDFVRWSINFILFRLSLFRMRMSKLKLMHRICFAFLWVFFFFSISQ